MDDLAHQPVVASLLAGPRRLFVSEVVGFVDDHEVVIAPIHVGEVQEKETVLTLCKYAVINGSHTTIGEIIGKKRKPIIGIPVYDEHSNNLKWIQDRKLGLLALNSKQVLKAIQEIKANYNKYEENLQEFSRNFDGNGAENTAKIVNEMLETRKRL